MTFTLKGKRVGPKAKYRWRVAHILLILTYSIPLNWFKPVLWPRVSENQRNMDYPLSISDQKQMIAGLLEE